MSETESEERSFLILESAIKLSQVIVAYSIFKELGYRYSDLDYQDTKKIRNELQIDYELCKNLVKQLNNIFGQDFLNDFLSDIQNRIEKGQASKIKLQPGMLAARIDKNFSANVGDIELATTYGYEIAREVLKILQGLEAYRNGVQLLEALIGIEPISTEPQLFKSNSHETIASSSPVVSALEAQTRTDLWKNSEKGAIFIKTAKNNSTNLIEHYVSSPGDITILPWNEAKQIIDKFGLDTAKLHLIFAAYCMNSDKPWNSRFYLKASDIIKYLGWDKRTDLSKGKRLNEVAKLAFVLGCLLVKVTWIEGKNKKGGIEASCPVGRMWDVVIDPKGQLNIHGKIDNPNEVIISIRPGGWTELFLNKAGQKAREALYQFSWLSAEVLKIDPYHDELALRLALTLTLKNRFHKNGRYQVETLLSDILPQTEINTAKEERQRGSDLKKRWDKALLLLASLGWRISYDPKTYPKWLQPNSQERNPKGYLDVFFSAMITIHQPEFIPALINSRASPIVAEPTLSTKSEVLTGHKLQEWRTAKRWSQRKLAKSLNVSQTLIQMIEQDKRDITPKIATKLNHLMNTDL
ncbi:MAG: helix-turn-helix transcriptional regulator [Nostocaceae cyanobacterium]|nr:helix-turn-helix transcriptional regulator [Nostocaceae cyanobacterium]